MTSAVPDKIGNYKLLEKIGQGGMGTLYRALDPKIGRHVAIKLLREGSDTSEMRERLLREARSAGGLKHGNIVTIFELGEHLGQPFIAMEYIQGETLTTFLTHRPASPLHRKLQIIDQLCAGLHYAHRMGVVHRDIKPANIMIDTEGTVKILDFGIARMGPSTTTLMGMMVGTLNYMAPEQMEGRPVDARADIFSVGAVIYELFSYRPAFSGSTQSEVMFAILNGQPKPLAEVCPGLDPDLIAIVDSCLQKRPEDRFQDLAALRQALGAARTRIERNARSKTVLMPLPSPAAPKKDSSSVNRLRSRAEQMRTEQIQAHLERGQRALEAGDHDGAFSACEQVFVLEPQNQQALALEEQTRVSQERVWLQQAHAELERGAFTAAWLLTERLIGMNADSPDVTSLRHAIEDARARQAQAPERSPATHGVPDDTRARTAVDKARRLFDAGDLAGAFAVLQGFTPAHSTVSEALTMLRREARELERRHAEAERLRIESEEQRAEAERQRIEIERQRMEAEGSRSEPVRRAGRVPPPQPQSQPHPLTAPFFPEPSPAEPSPPAPQPQPVVAPVAAAAPPVAVRESALARPAAPTFPMPSPQPPQPAPRSRTPAPRTGGQPSRAPILLLFGMAGLVGILAIAIGVRFAMLRRTPPPADAAPPPITAVPPQAPPPLDSGGVVLPPRDAAPPLGGAQKGLGDRTPPLTVPPATTVVPANGGSGGQSARDRALADQYTRAKAAFDAGAFASALKELEALQHEDPGYRDVADLIARSRAAIASAVKQAMDDAGRLEAAGDLAEAAKRLERVAQIDPSMGVVAEQSLARIRNRMKTEGTAVFLRAKNFEVLDLVDEAIKAYEQALRVLPDDDPNKKTARERLDRLRARK